MRSRLPRPSDQFQARLGVATESKRRVAACAATLISPGTTAILGGGTAALAVASALAPDLTATIVTPSPATAAALVNHATVMSSFWAAGH